MVWKVLEHKQMKINYKGRIHFQEWYKLIYEILVKKGYTSSDAPGDKNFETYLSDLINSDGTHNHWIWWRTSRKKDEMFTYVIDVDFQTILLGDVKLMHHGKKLKVNDGEANTFIRAKLLINQSEIWEKNWFMKEIYDLVQRKHLRDQISIERAKLYEEALEVHDRAKQALGCLTVRPREAYHIDEKAFPDV